MKKQIGSFIKNAIQYKDFIPLQDGDGTIRIHETVNVLVKKSYGSLAILELIDGDRLSLEAIGARLEQNGRRLDEMGGTQACYVMEVFLFEEEPGQEIKDIISNAQIFNVSRKKHLTCMTVNLQARSVTNLSKTPVTDFGLQKLLKSWLESEIGDEIAVDEIKELVDQKEKEYTLELKAKTPALTYLFIALNVLVWGLLRVYSIKSGTGYNDLLHIFGEKNNISILNGEYWRFFTPIFLHVNEIHLFVNCYSLYALGTTVERIFGHARFLGIYLIAGIIGNIASFAFSSYPAVGASGAIFGLLGAMLYFGIIRPALFKAYFGYGIISSVLINLVYGFSNTGIDNFAHMGGLAGGFLASGAVQLSDKRRWYLNRFLFLGLTLVVAFSGLFYSFNNKQNRILLKVQQIERMDKEQKWNEAEKTGKEILSLNPKDNLVRVKVLWTIAKAEALSGKYQEGVEHAKMLRDLDPRNGHYLLGILYYDMKQYTLSKEELLQAKKLNAGYQDIDKLLENIDNIQKGKTSG